MLAAMYVVALTRWNAAATLEQELPSLALAIGVAPYDARLKLVAPAPSVLRGNLASEPAHALLATLRARGHGAVACDMNSVPVPRKASAARGIELGADSLAVIYELDRRVRVMCADILAVVRAVEELSESQRTQTVDTKFDIKGAVITGGLKLTKTVTTVASTSKSERQPVAYLFHSASPEPLLIKENVLHYEGLGAMRGTTAHQSFEALIGWLRRNAPGALHDDRLLTHKRRTETLVVRGALTDRSVSTSNASANDLAAYLLLLAYLEQQL